MSCPRQISKFFYQTGDILKGTSLFKNLDYLYEYRDKDRECVASVQNSLLRKLAGHAYKSTKFYKEYYSDKQVPINDLDNLTITDLPVVHKNHVQEKYPEFVSDKYSINKITKFRSSGSTGEPKTFYYDQKTYGWRMANFFYNWQQGGFNFGDSWLRLSLYPRKGFVGKLSDYFSRCVYVDLMSFDLQKLNNIQEKLQVYKPDFIYAYSSAANLVASHLEQKGSSPPSVKGIITQGDMLFPEYRKRIERAFNTKVYDTYGGDGMVISGQCSLGSYHLNELGVIMEVVDDNYRPVAEGTVGRILVTDLRNFVMPLIRYEIGDMGSLQGGTCGCGSNFKTMGIPLGRDTDIIKLSNGISLIVHFFTVLFTKYPEVVQFQARELDTDIIKLNLVVNEMYTKSTFERINKDIMNYCRGGVEIIENIVKDIPPEQSNKRRFVISKLK